MMIILKKIIKPIMKVINNFHYKHMSRMEWMKDRGEK